MGKRRWQIELWLDVSEFRVTLIFYVLSALCIGAAIYFFEVTP